MHNRGKHRRSPVSTDQTRDEEGDDFDATISASNQWGVGSAVLQFTFDYAPITGLAIADVS